MLGASLALYVATCAPGVLWADSGHLQLSATIGRAQGSAGSHPLWVWIAHAATRIPMGQLAGRVNLTSALFAAITVALLHRTLRELGVGAMAAVLAAAALAVAHTFWSHAVVAEVYALTLAFMALVVWLALRWRRTGRRAYLAATGWALGAGLLAHLLVALCLPAVLWLLWTRRRSMRAADLAGFVTAGLVGVAPLVALVWRDAAAGGMDLGAALRWALFTFEGYDFSAAMVDLDWRLLPADALEWLAYLGLQYVGLALVAGVVGVWAIGRRAGRDRAVFVALLYIAGASFAFAYRVGDRYVFYLPSYLAFALWIGYGFDRFLAAPGAAEARWLGAMMLLLVTAAPVGAYRLAPEIVAQGVTIRDTRHVPGPRGRLYFLWPPKTGYDDADAFARRALASMPAGGVLLAEPVLAAPLAFVQQTEGLRPDVDIHYCCWDLTAQLAGNANRPVALADRDPARYAADALAGYRLEPMGDIYRVVESQ